MKQIEKLKALLSIYCRPSFRVESIEGTRINEVNLYELKCKLNHLVELCNLVFNTEFMTMGNLSLMLFDEDSLDCQFDDNEFDVLLLASKLHGLVERKTGKYLYIQHPIKTSLEAKKRYNYDKLLVPVMLLHDTLEDCNIDRLELIEKLKTIGYSLMTSYLIANRVKELTNVYTKKSYPDLNKSQRTHKESDRLSRCSLLAMKGKSLDIYDNTSDVDEMGEYGKVYLGYKRYTIDLFYSQYPTVFEWIKTELDNK